MIAVTLPVEEWNKVLAILAQAPWHQANPLIMAMGDQLRAQAAGPPAARGRPNGPVEGPEAPDLANRPQRAS